MDEADCLALELVEAAFDFGYIITRGIDGCLASQYFAQLHVTLLVPIGVVT
jgi:hypothetical protein